MQAEEREKGRCAVSPSVHLIHRFALNKSSSSPRLLPLAESVPACHSTTRHVNEDPCETNHVITLVGV